jgi:hypothetical protein
MKGLQDRFGGLLGRDFFLDSLDHPEVTEPFQMVGERWTISLVLPLQGVCFLKWFSELRLRCVIVILG